MRNQPVKFKGERVLTTKVLANLLEVSSSTVCQIVNKTYKANKIFSDKLFDDLVEGTDYYEVTSEERPYFVDSNRGAILDINFRGGKFRVFTKSGTAKIARNLKRFNLYYDRIYGYFSLSDLSEFYIRNKKYFLTKKESVREYKENNSLRLDQIEKSLEVLSAKIEEQRGDIDKRLTFLEARIDKLIIDRLK